MLTMGAFSEVVKLNTHPLRWCPNLPTGRSWRSIPAKGEAVQGQAVTR